MLTRILTLTGAAGFALAVSVTAHAACSADGGKRPGEHPTYCTVGGGGGGTGLPDGAGALIPCGGNNCTEPKIIVPCSIPEQGEPVSCGCQCVDRPPEKP